MSESELQPEPDLAEQRRDTAEEAEDPEASLNPDDASVPFEVNEADAVEQHLEVGLDEDDYR